MTEIAHTFVGAAVGSRVKNAFLAFIIGFASHFIMDALPHWAFYMNTWQVSLSGLFFSLGVIALIFIVPRNGFYKKTIPAGIFGAIAPDLFEIFLEYFAPSLQGNYFSQFHHLIQWEVSFVWGVPLQIIFIAVSFWIIYKTKKEQKG